MSSTRFTAFDAVLLVLGLVFLGIGVVSVVATASIIVNWSDPGAGFPAGPGFIRSAKGFGLAFFPITALVAFAVGWWLAGGHIKRAFRREREASRAVNPVDAGVPPRVRRAGGHDGGDSELAGDKGRRSV